MQFKILTCIPAFRPEFLDDILLCLHSQTLKPDLVIFSDDTQDLKIIERFKEEPLKKLSDGLNIIYIAGSRRGPVKNIEFLEILVGIYSPKYVHFFLDDDLIFPTFYEHHSRVLEDTGAAVTVSSRVMCTLNKIPIGVAATPESVKAREPLI